MNYKAETLFDAQEVKKPSARFQPIYSWIWNSPITEELIISQIDKMQEWGICALYIIPEPPEFRPNSMVTYMTPEYLSDEFFALVRFAINYAKTKNMVVWLYDEGGWPSGAACGKVVQMCPDTCSKIIVEQKTEIKKDEIYKASHNILCAFTEEFDKITSVYKAPKDGYVYEYLIKEEKIHLPCLLEKDAVDTFITLTYDGYKKALGEDFANLCPVIFTDEAILHYPYIIKDAECFKAKTGFDFYANLPAVFHQDAFGEEGEKFRIAYMEYTSNEFANAYMQQIKDWCAQNGLLLAGHMDGDHTLSDYTRNIGNILKLLRCMDIPGVDVIWNQIVPEDKKNHLFPRLASSAANMTGKYYALTESFAVYGSGLTYDRMRYIINAQAVRGINVINIMSMSSGTDGFIPHQFRPNFLLETPVTKFLKNFNEYISRISYMTSVGKPCRNVAVYLPLRDLWAQHSETAKVQECFYALCNQLEEAYVDFDIIDDEYIDGTQISDGKLCAGFGKYSTIYIPFCKYMPEHIIEKLTVFIKSGGNVIADRGLSVIKDATLINEERILQDSLAEAADFQNQLRMSKRITTDGDIVYMIFNEGETAFRGKITLRDICKRNILQCDIQNGGFYQKDSKVNLALESGEAVFFLCTDKDIPQQTTGLHTVISIQEMSGFCATITEEFKIDNLTPVLVANKEVIGKTPFAKYDDKKFSGGVLYETVFEYHNNQQNLMIDLGNVNGCCIVEVNKKEVQRTFLSPHLVEIPSQVLSEGENHLSITVYNTAANVYANMDFENIPLKVRGPYHGRTLELEKQGI